MSRSGKLNLLVLAQGYPSPANPIAGSFHKNQMAALAALGCDVTLVAPTPYVPPFLTSRNPRWKAYAEMPLEQWDGPLRILRPRYPTTPRENQWGLPHLAQSWAIKRLGLPRPDIIQAFFALPTGQVARSLARQWQIPYVLSLLGDDVTIYPHYHRLAHRLFNQALQDAAAVTANGPALAKAAFQLSGVRPETLSLGVDFSRFDALPDKSEARRLLGLPADKAIALYVGYMVPQKGMAELDAATRQLNRSDLAVVCVGDGPERGRLEANPGILCVGPRPSQDIPLFMRAADLLILPSHHEGLPTVIIEAGGAGLPVIGSDIGGIVDLIGDDRGFAFPLKNAAGLAGVLAQALAEPAERQRRADRLHEFVHQHHDVIGNSRRLVDIYKTALRS